MPVKKYEWTETKYKKYLKEGRGKGTGRDYLPWLKTYNVPSHGRRARNPGWKTERLHHFMSDNETNYFYLLEWSDSVIDIREQYPLLQLETAQDIASDMGIEYPTDKNSKFPIVLTTDFMITVRDGARTFDIARTVKPSEELDKTRVIEKFEIERRYWAAKGIDWGIITEKEIPVVLSNNIEYLHPAYYLEPTAETSLPQLLLIADLLKDRLKLSKNSIVETISNFDNELRLVSGTCLKVFLHLVARKEILLDMNQKINVTKSAQTILKFVSRSEKGVKAA
ncbi:MAG: TnsA endonuclease N-terminal domain-containing protein [Pyrinomonadaceae bacterium]|nr:TnsA endonuclease N-terminal domain-containing protein [Pyrinomonadaceae bacterium]